MKKTMLLILALMIAAVIYAHPAKTVMFNVTGEIDTPQDITISIIHKVSNVKKHYISAATVTLNGKEILKKTFTAQSYPDKEEINLKQVLKEGDKLSVTSTCNVVGTKTFDYIRKK